MNCHVHIQENKIISQKLNDDLYYEIIITSISRFPDRVLTFPVSGKEPLGPEKSGIGIPELAIPNCHGPKYRGLVCLLLVL